MKLAEFIRDHSHSVSAGGQRVDAVLAEDLADILLAAADDLEGSSGALAATSALRPGAYGGRAIERLAPERTAEEVLREFRMLRADVVRAWLAQTVLRECPDRDDLVRFGEIMDDALAAALAHCDDRAAAADRSAGLHSKLADSERRFRALVNASSHAVYRLSPDGRQMRELDGRGAVVDTDSPSSSWLDRYIHPDDQPRAVEVFREAMRNRSLFELEHRYQRADGRIGWTLSRAVPLLDDDGRIIEWFGAASDVTARRRAQEALRDADRSKDEFLAVLGHELRNPLAPLRTSVELLERARSRPELIDDLRVRMDRQLAHLVRLVDDLLDISRISRGEVTLQRIPLDLNTSVEAAIEQSRAAVTGRRHDLHLHLSAEQLPVLGDYVRLTQVVANLLNNASKYMDPGGTITVTSALEDGRAVVRVRDAGYGIPPERFNRLFKLFSRIDEHSAQTGGGGLGVGLALSHQLITLHGGSLEVHSEGLGRGSEFVLRLDISDEALRPTAHPSRRSAQPPRRVMVVEDNVDAADTMRLLLELKGNTVQVAYDGSSALAQVAAFSPHVVLLDLGLPGMSGIDVARRIRDLHDADQMRLVAITGWGQWEDRQRTGQAGFDEHITKPVGADDIDRVLASLPDAGSD